MLKNMNNAYCIINYFVLLQTKSDIWKNVKIKKCNNAKIEI
jgi:hypothetical protein